MKKYVMEFTGTFFLVLTIGLADAPLTIGLVLAGLIYIGGHVSGAHYNPAVSLGFLFLRNIKIHEFIGYVLAQVFGSSMACVALLTITSMVYYIEPPYNTMFAQQVAAELIFTLVFVWLILTVSMHRFFKKNFAFGFIIGLVLAGLISLGEPLSGAMYNPAVFLGSTIIDSILGGASYQHSVLYVLFPMVAGAGASALYAYFKDQ
ncbi:MAG: aquaporin [Bacteroidota bacterium]